MADQLIPLIIQSHTLVLALTMVVIYVITLSIKLFDLSINNQLTTTAKPILLQLLQQKAARARSWQLNKADSQDKATSKETQGHKHWNTPWTQLSSLRPFHVRFKTNFIKNASWDWSQFVLRKYGWTPLFYIYIAVCKLETWHQALPFLYSTIQVSIN